MDYLVLIVAALTAGTVNAVAAGGSFFTFPALVFVGLPPVIANASSSVVIFPAIFASAWAYRQDRKDFDGVGFKSMLGVSIAGGTTGATLLLSMPESAFELIIPWLLLLATIVFAFGPRLATLLKRRADSNRIVFLGAQFLASVYGGYFGGAVGLVMLAFWGLFGVRDIRMMNANRTVLGGSMNAAAVLIFVVARKVWWTETLIMLVAAVIGGYFGARFARRLNPVVLRAIITVISVGVTIAFFVRYG